MADPVSLSVAASVMLIDGAWIDLAPGTLSAVIDPTFTDPVTGQPITPGDVWFQWADTLGQAYAAPMRSIAAVKLAAPVA